MAIPKISQVPYFQRTGNMFPLIDRSDASTENIERAKDELFRTGMRKFCVMSLRDGREHRSPWFRDLQRTRQAASIIEAKGFRNIVYID